MVNFGDALRKGVGFAIEPKRWLPLFILDVSFIGVFFAVFFPAVQGIMLSMPMAGTGPMIGTGNSLIWLPFAGYILGMVLLGISWYILRFWIIGSLIHQSCRPLETRRGYDISISRLHKLIAVAFLVGLISGLVGTMYLVGWILSLVIGLAFFFMLQGIVVDNLGVVSTLNNSWKIFRKSPFDVFVSWLLIAIVSGLISLVFALPLIYMFAGFFVNAFITTGFTGGGGADPMVFSMLMIYVESNLGIVAAFGLIALVGSELSQVFSLKAQTELYLQFRKRFPAILKSFSDKIGHFF